MTHCGTCHENVGFCPACPDWDDTLWCPDWSKILDEMEAA